MDGCQDVSTRYVSFLVGAHLDLRQTDHRGDGQYQLTPSHSVVGALSSADASRSFAMDGPVKR